MLVAAANYHARSLADVMPGVPPKLAQIVDKALAFDKALRWPTARAMQAALRSVPGRVSVGESFESGRRSIPDESPASFEDKTVANKPNRPATDEEKTVMRTGVEELRSDEYEAVGSWQTNERTVAVNLAVPKAALPSNFPPAPGEGITGDRTMIMEGAPVQPAPATQPIPTPAAPHAPFGFVETPQPFTVPQRPPSDPNIMAPPMSNNEMMFVAGPARPAPPAEEGGGSRLLVFIAVALVSMVVVIVTGLFILAASV
jgi:serine/threonine-protein kinase